LACNDPEIAQKLWGVVEEETRGLDTGSAGHNELAIRFAESIGLSKNQLENAELRPSTAAHLYYVELIIHTLPWFVVMSIQIGAEGTFGPAAAAIGNGLLKNYNMKPDDVRFFTVHSEADEDHGSLAEEIAVRYRTHPPPEQTYKSDARRERLRYSNHRRLRQQTYARCGITNSKFGISRAKQARRKVRNFCRRTAYAQVAA
jgi:pyrroloquinoline quinone (PQQ) biosynthesis protein C